MTEFEAATIAYQNASLAIQQGSLAIQQGSLSLATWQTVLSAATLAISSGLVLYGFRLMRLGTEARNRQLDAMEAAQREQAEALGKIGEGIAELLRRPA